MPRTKRVRSVQAAGNSENVKPGKTTTTKVVRDMVNSYLKALDSEVAVRKIAMQTECERIKLKLFTSLEELSVAFSQSANKTVAELQTEYPISSVTACESTSLKNITSNTTRNERNLKRRSSSLGTESASSRSRSQSAVKKAKNARISRSVSRTKLQQPVTTTNSYKTPVSNNIIPASFGLVTPKVKPNTPQIVLRRPKHGEIAISMQGSPLMVGSIISDQKANVNIPLVDGRVLSIQPQRGLRTSQIPELDAETKRQIETLRDNLNRVCALANRS